MPGLFASDAPVELHGNGDVVLAADQISVWEDDNDRWIRLEGHATIYRNESGYQAQVGLVRSRGTAEGGRDQRLVLEIYLEGLYEVGPMFEGSIPETIRLQANARRIDIKPPLNGSSVIFFKGRPPRGPLIDWAFREEQQHSTPSPLQSERVRAVVLESQTNTQQPRVDDSFQPTFFQGDESGLGPRLALPAVPTPYPDIVPSAPPPAQGAADPSPVRFQEDDLSGFPGGELPRMPRLPDGFQDFPDLLPPDDLAPDDLAPLPDVRDPSIPSELPTEPSEPPPSSSYDPGQLSEIPIIPGTQRVVRFFFLDRPENRSIDRFPPLNPGDPFVFILKGKVNITVDDDRFGVLDAVADNVVIWKGGDGSTNANLDGPQSVDESFEMYLEGNVEILRDKKELVGEQDRSRANARRFYVDLRTQRFLGLDAELEQYAPGLLAPLRTTADSITQYRDFVRGPDGQIVRDERGRAQLGLATIRAQNAVTTGSRFADPGYRIRSRTIDFFELPPDRQRSRLRQRILDPLGTSSANQTFLVDARRNLFFLGPIPTFFWPRYLTTTEDISPPLEQISFRTNNLFGQMILTDWDIFKLLAIQKPSNVDDWNLDVDYLSDRGVAVGSEFGYFGVDFSEEVFGIDLAPGITSNYFGYFDLYGINDNGLDNLGEGPAVVTNGPPGAMALRSSVPPFQDFRGRLLFRHMQSLLPDDADPLDDFRVQLEAAYISDRRFLEQYFKRLSDSGLDQQTRIFAIRQWRNRAVTGLLEANLHDWYTDSQWLPKLDYYRLGGAPLGLGRFISYSQHSGVSFANTHTAVETNDPDLFAFLPYDPISATSGPFRTGRIFTNHQVDVPINLRFLRVTPYVQGQLIGWDNQYDAALPSLGFVPGLSQADYIRGTQGSTVGRAWGAYGVRADVSLTAYFRNVESDLFNVHGLAHKINLSANYRDAYSTLDLERIGVQDDLDDNTYEFTRRYFALTGFGLGVLPAQYSPLLLTLRRGSSPITGSTDVQDRIETLRFGVSQRLQTKRGPADSRRIIDYMVMDVSTNFYPDPSRDNFGSPFGLTQYQYEWFVGDRTSIVSDGLFEFFDIEGDILGDEPERNGVRVISAGVNFNRPPRGQLFLGYTILNSGPISTSALNASTGYWLSPKWYGTFGGLYDFGEGLLISTSFSLTRIGADFLTTVGLNFTPLQDNVSFVFELVPRFSPQTRFGSAGGVPYRSDLRFAPPIIQ